MRSAHEERFGPGGEDDNLGGRIIPVQSLVRYIRRDRVIGLTT